MNKLVKKEIPMGSKTLVLETGKIARQASASVIASMGNTVVTVSYTHLTLPTILLV